MRTQLRNVLALVTLLTAPSAEAQYSVLPTGYSLWVEAWWPGPGYTISSWYLDMDTSQPDTIVNGTAYERIAAYDAFAIRDNGQGQVFFLKNNDPVEYLLYDFDVSVGDTVRFGTTLGFPSVDSVVVISVDTINQAGVDRKRIGVSYDMDGNWPCGYWIQGIGSTVGLFNPCAGPSVSGSQWLACMSVDGITMYGSNPGQPGNCLDAMGTTSLDERGIHIDVWPNPGSGSLTISAHSGKASHIRIFDMQGAMVGAWNMSGDRLVLPTEVWPSGLYMIEVSSNGSVPQTIKWIRE